MRGLRPAAAPRWRRGRVGAAALAWAVGAAAAELGWLRGRGPESRRLSARAIDACPTDWEMYMHPEAMKWVCECQQVSHNLHLHEPATTNDHSHTHEACPTSTARPALTTPPATTTTLKVTTKTTTTSTTVTTLYCEACVKVTPAATAASTSRAIAVPATTVAASTTSGAATTVAATTTASGATTAAATGSSVSTSASTSASTAEASATVTSSGTTTTTTTVTETIPVLQSCSICPLFHFLCPDGCTNCITPGKCRTVFHSENRMFDDRCDHRRAITGPDTCVEFVDVQMSCPADNEYEGRAVVLDSGAYPLIKCRVCGIAHLKPDGNRYANRWAGQVTWGPNQFLGEISETEIWSYRLYVVDAQYQKLGKPVATQEARRWATLSTDFCCDTSFYKATLDIALPQNFTYFMVVPITRVGFELNVGPVSDRIEDNVQLSTSANGAVRSRAWAAALAVPMLLARR